MHWAHPDSVIVSQRISWISHDIKAQQCVHEADNESLVKVVHPVSAHSLHTIVIQRKGERKKGGKKRITSKSATT